MKAKIVKYGHLQYKSIIPEIEEIPCSFGSFSKKVIKRRTKLNYSLHTEYSANNLQENTINELKKYNFLNLANCLKSKKANLWCSIEWTLEFIDFINYIVDNYLDKYPPTIIEIHPPYATEKDYEKKMKDFFKLYIIFEKEIKKLYGNKIIILLENRNMPSNFLLSKSSDYIKFKDYIIRYKLDLKLIVDIAQLYSKMIRTYKRVKEKK